MRSAARQLTSSLPTPEEVPQPPGSDVSTSAEADEAQSGAGAGAPQRRLQSGSPVMHPPPGGWPVGWNRMTRDEKLAYVRRRLESLEQRAGQVGADKSIAGPLRRVSPGLPVGADNADVRAEAPITISAPTNTQVICDLGHMRPAVQAVPTNTTVVHDLGYTTCQPAGLLGFVAEVSEAQQGNSGACIDEYKTGPKGRLVPASTPRTCHGDATHPAAGETRFPQLPRIRRQNSAGQEMVSMPDVGSDVPKL